MSEAAFETLRLELRRGVLVMAVLARSRDEHCGYTLRQRLAEDGLSIDEGTLYPLLRRLEKQALLTSEWRYDQKRRKRFYRLTASGEEVLERLVTEWRTLGSAVDPIL